MKEKNKISSILIVSGLSGAGKSSALRILEDLNYFCIDNLPIPLIIDFLNLIKLRKELKRVALGIDVRGYIFEENLSDLIKKIKESSSIPIKILFLESNDETIIHRYSETRRPHPLCSEGPIIKGIEKERELLSPIREIADYIIDTSQLTVHDLRRLLTDRFGLEQDKPMMKVQVVSFGYRYGLPVDCDLVFDVRFLPNPYFNKKLRKKTGLDKEVKEYIEQFKETKLFLEKIKELLEFLLPLYEKEGKAYLTIGIGCTGGQHRSVTIAEDLTEFLKRKWNVKVLHRDSNKWYK